MKKETNFICEKAKEHFSKLKVTDGTAIIFDLDDTLLYHYHFLDQFSFAWIDNAKLMKAKNENQSLPILHVLNLYNFYAKKDLNLF